MGTASPFIGLMACAPVKTPSCSRTSAMRSISDFFSASRQ
jgi:hypothetical protein